MVLTLFLIKFLVSFILLFSFLGYNSAVYILDNPSALDGAVYIPETNNLANDGIIIDYGEVTLGGVSQTSNTFGTIWGMAKFIYSSSVLERFFEVRFGLEIPYLIWFFLLDIWAYLLTLQFIRIFVKG